MSSEEVFVLPASFAQQRLWFFDQLLPGSTIYSVPTVIRLTGSPNIAALKQAFNEIVRRHEVLRTTFIIESGQLMQAIAPSLSIPLTTLDLRELPTEQREKEAKEAIAIEIERPFNLSREPLLRVALLTLSETEHILLTNMHHIICDDWSIGVLIRELRTLYAAFTQKQPAFLPKLPLQYADFAHWQREWLQGEVLANQLAYWQKQLNDISVLQLPTDKRRPDIQSYQGATQPLELPKNLVSSLQKLSQQEGVTLFMTLLAAFQVLLYRYTHQEDIAVGSPIANRNRSEIEGLIGFFVNTLVLRSNLSGNPTFRELLSRVKEVTLGAYSHQDLPFEKLVEHLHPERNLNYHPLFQVVFGFENAPMETLELPELVPSFMDLDFKTTRFDLELHLWKCDGDFRSLWGNNWQYSDGLRGIVVYNTELFDKATISRLLKHFTTLLEGIVANSEQRIAHLPLVSEAELHQILVQWNNTQTDYPQDQCIHQLFEQQVEHKGDAIALKETRHVTSVQYEELNKRSNQLARYLQKRGVTESAVVGICTERSIEMIVGMLGILKAGGAYLPLDPSYPRDRINFMLEDAQASILITQSKFASNFEGFSNIVIYLDRDWEFIEQESKQNLNSNINSNNLAYLIYTSGSTGKPKGVAVTHKAVIRLVCNTNYIKFTDNDKIAQISNTSFDAATFEIWGALLNGIELVVMDKDLILSPHEFALQLQNQNISILFLTTALFQQIARNVPHAIACLRYLLFGGETVDTRWVKKILKTSAPWQLVQVYGPTENTTFSSYYHVQELPESATSIPIGRPIANTQIYLLDTNLQPVPIGVVGELYIGGDGLARGYLNRPELTETKFISLPNLTRLYKTGDLARYLPDGNIEFLGRIDNQIKIRGFRVELEEIETVLSQHPAVRETAVIATEDIPGDRRLVAYIVPNEEQTFTSTNLREFLKQKLPEYTIPSAYIVLDSLPLTPNGKVDRQALPAVDTFNLEIKEDYIAPRTQLERVLVEIWTQILGKEQIGIHDNFFELGGHSLLATQLISRVRDVLKVDLPLRNVFEAPTVASQTKYIETVLWVASPPDTSTATENQREQLEF